MSDLSPARCARFCAALVAIAMSPVVRAASTSCESSFKELKGADGATLYRISSTYRPLDIHEALDQYLKIAVDDGYVPVTAPAYDAAIPSLGILRRPSPHPVAIMIDRKASSISLTSIVNSGRYADPAEELTRLCELVSHFEASGNGIRNLHEPRRTAEEQQMEARTTIPVSTPAVHMLSPDVPFDIVSAKAALEPGRSTIRGQACGGFNGAIAYASGSKVFLYPVTPYWEQLVQMSKKAKPGRDRLAPDPNALKTRMEATANSTGEFQFSQMRPGRYFLLTTLSAVLGGSRDVYAGRVTDGYGTANVYTTQGYTFDSSNELSKFVEVRSDGDVVKVTLQPPITANPFHRGMRGSLLGCHALP